MVNFFRDFKAVNSKNIPVVNAFSQTGWRNKNFFVYPSEQAEYLVDVGNEVNLLDLFRPRGDRRQWIDVYNTLKPHKFFRLAVAASLAAPMLKFLGSRNMTLQFWSQSGDGKTAILKFADSVFKNPDPLVKFNSSLSFLEARAVDLSDFPLAVDELKTADSDLKVKNKVELFAHLVEGGASKGRANKFADQGAIRSFRTIAIITGEHPLTSCVSDMGIKRRTLEIHSGGIFPASLRIKGQSPAPFLHHFVSYHHALVGQDWINFLSNSEHQAQAIAKFNEFQSALLETRPDSFVDHCNLLAACATADFLFNRYIVGDQDDTTSNVLFDIEHSFVDEHQEKDSVRAFFFIIDWINKFMSCFVDENQDTISNHNIFGWIKGKGSPEESFLIIPSVLHDALSNAGFSSRKVLTELANEGFISSQTVKNRAKSDYSIVQRIKGVDVKRVVKIDRFIIDSFISKNA